MMGDNIIMEHDVLLYRWRPRQCIKDNGVDT